MDQAPRTPSAPPARSHRLRLPRPVTLLCVAFGVLSPSPAFAHVKWFADEEYFPLRTDMIVSDLTLLTITVATLAVIAFVFLERRLGDANWPNLPIFRRMATGAPTILAIQAAIGLVASAAHGNLISPNLHLPQTPLGVAFSALELVIAMTFITGIFDWVGALALIALLPVGAVLCDSWDVLEQALWFGIAVVILVIGRGSAVGWRARPWLWRRNPAWTERAQTILRVSTGIGFIVVALGEKLWNPDLGRAFLTTHPMFNVFHETLGLSWFSDDLFVLFIGVTEATIGALLISGRLTRLVVLMMWLPFHLGIPLLPSQELIGHLPVFGIMYVLLVHGSAARGATSVLQQRPQISTAVARRLRPTPATFGSLPHRDTLPRLPVAHHRPLHARLRRSATHAVHTATR